MIALEKIMPQFRRAMLRRATFCRFVRLLPPLALFLLSASCNGFFVSESSIQSVAITPTAVLLKGGLTPADSYSALTSTATTVGGTQTTDTTTATWSSSSDPVVTVKAGVLTAGASTTANATATVTAKDSGVTSNACSVVLYTGTAPTTLTVGNQTGVTTFAAGTTFQAIATGTFTGDTNLSAKGAMTPYVTWTPSSDTTIYTISSSGLVTVVSAGTGFAITATATFGSADTSGSATGTSLEFNNSII
jgi:hypothetical protein